MLKRYGWTREYKGSHPRGNLSIPDYKAAKAKERSEVLERATREEIKSYMSRVRNFSLELQNDVKQMFENSTAFEKVLHYLEHCSEEDYTFVMDKINDFWYHFAAKEEGKSMASLTAIIKEAQKKAAQQNTSESTQVKAEVSRFRRTTTSHDV